ncbi:alpha/beta fold hydrolase [Nakamurella lactea]|uniref:alpha/beta fold hydrolase n=1 Tax=Nakamurella lactea TaxID=459515 RepID=UPI0004291C12|nr:alpha/beta hydrolase [Nakamurella lactea]
MDIVLIPGLWLNGPSWDPVTRRLERAGHRVQALTLPGMESRDADRSGITLDDHVAAVVAALDGADGPAVVVGHSASGTLAYCAADAGPDKVKRLLYVGGFPARDGELFMSGLPTDGADAPFPGWAEFEGPDSADLDEATKDRLLGEFIPSPAGVLAGTVRLTNDRRIDIPATAVCPEYSPEDLRAWLDHGDVPELARATDLSMVDIDSGHWPQITVPDKLAELILAEVAR